MVYAPAAFAFVGVGAMSAHPSTVIVLGSATEQFTTALLVAFARISGFSFSFTFGFVAVVIVASATAGGKHNYDPQTTDYCRERTHCSPPFALSCRALFSTLMLAYRGADVKQKNQPGPRVAEPALVRDECRGLEVSHVTEVAARTRARHQVALSTVYPAAIAPARVVISPRQRR